MSMTDGVNKIFVVKNELHAMHFEGYKTEREMVEEFLYHADYGLNHYNAENQVAWLRSLHAKIDETIKKHLELDSQNEEGDEA